MKTEHLIILHSESVLDSWARDASTFALIAATIGTDYGIAAARAAGVPVELRSLEGL